MDMGLVRGLITLAVFVLFIAIVVWAYSKKRRKTFEELAAMPLDEDRTVSEVRRDKAHSSEENKR